jgi:hypothetical protein
MRGIFRPSPVQGAADLIVFVALFRIAHYATALQYGRADGIARSIQLSDRNPKFSVAVRASADGRFTFEIFRVSGEPKTIKFESRHYSSPGDAERAGYEAIAANGLQTKDIDKARRAGSGQDLRSTQDNESSDGGAACFQRSQPTVRTARATARAQGNET